MAAETPEQARVLQLYNALPGTLRRVAIEILERLSHRDARTGPFGWLMGYHYVEAGPGRVQCTMEVTTAHTNPSKVAHGGVLCTLADAAMGGAVHVALEPGQRVVTAELKVNYLKPVPTGRITAEATVVQRGKRLAVVTAEIRDAAGQLVGVALGTFAIIPRRSTLPDDREHMNEPDPR